MANYLYNGVALPALPEWDKTAYPYAYICLHYQKYVFFVSSYKSVIASTNAVFSAENLSYEVEGNEWVQTDSIGGSYPLIWTNTDHYSDSGVLQFAASDPIPVAVNPPDPLSLVMGYRVGCAIRANRGKKTITGYSYNGTVLPALPEWDRETYPYAFLTYLESSETADLYVSTVPFVGYSYENPDYYNGISVYVPTGAEYYHYVKDQSKQDWVMFPDFALDIIKDKALSFGEEKLPAVWSNHDIINTEDDSVYLAASDPIPVYA